MGTLSQLKGAVEGGCMPVGRIVYLGLGMLPQKNSSIKIEMDELPTGQDCLGLTGLDIVLTYRGNFTNYGTLRHICGALLNANPRRLLIIDIDLKRSAYLKVVNV